jgi:hypothetical protein
MPTDEFNRSERPLGRKDWLGQAQGVDQLSCLGDGSLRWETIRTWWRILDKKVIERKARKYQGIEEKRREIRRKMERKNGLLFFPLFITPFFPFFPFFFPFSLLAFLLSLYFSFYTSTHSSSPFLVTLFLIEGKNQARHNRTQDMRGGLGLNAYP